MKISSGTNVRIVRSLTLVLVMINICLLISCPSLFVNTADDTGDNDDFTDATFISPTTNSWTGAITSSTDIDVYERYFETGWYYIDMTGLSADLDIELYDSEETYRNSSEESGTTDERIHQSIITAGYYFIVVYGYWGDKSSYTITISQP